MSLLDDVSIVVTPNAYKAGTLYGVLPTATEGSELVTSWTNKDFASFASSGSNITQMVSSGSGNNNYSALTITSGKTYKLQFTSSQAITCQIRISANTNLTGASVVLNSLVLGTNEVYFTASSTYAYIGFYAPNSFTDTQISSFTLKEVTQNNLARVNYDGTASSLLVEPQRTNIVPYSEDLSQWTIANGTLTPNATVSPDGIQNAGRVVFNNTGLDLKTTVTVVAGQIYTISFYIKLESGAGLQGRFYDNSNGANIEYYTFTSQVQGTQWSRVTRSVTAPSGCTEMQIWLLAASSSLVTASFWGAQFEAGSYSTSYIPTSGSTVTRVAESYVLPTTISLDSDFCLFWDGEVLEGDIMLYGSGNNNSWYMNYSTGSGRIILDESSGRKVQAFLGSGSPVGVKTKILIRRSSGVHSVFANGTKLTNTVSVNSTTTLSLVSMFWSFNSSFNKGLEVNQSQVFKTSLSDSEAIALTSL